MSWRRQFWLTVAAQLLCILATLLLLSLTGCDAHGVAISISWAAIWSVTKYALAFVAGGLAVAILIGNAWARSVWR